MKFKQKEKQDPTLKNPTLNKTVVVASPNGTEDPAIRYSTKAAAVPDEKKPSLKSNKKKHSLKTLKPNSNISGKKCQRDEFSDKNDELPPSSSHAGS